jgi:alkylation response protein AidB-like acyl-CoA dehydrogenase
MDVICKPDLEVSRVRELLRAVAAELESPRAGADDVPIEGLDALRRHGALIAVLPRHLGGLGFGTEPEGADGLLALLRLVGRVDLSLGRIFEGHVNAVQLVLRYGNPMQAEAAARDVIDGHLFAIWNTEAPPGVRRDGNTAHLTGHKSHCSAAGVATRGLITVDQHERGGRLLLTRLRPGERSGLLVGTMHGMRATRSGWVDFEAYVPDEADWIGQPGDYLREPVFSAGAWRALAAILGSLEALTGEICSQLQARHRDSNPHQRARVAEALIAQNTTYLWVRECARLADGSDYTTPGLAEFVNLARRAVEAACLDTLRLAQRGLGLAAFIDTNPVEPLMRDLATYLRQPAMDEALDEAAAYFIINPSPLIGPLTE